MNKHEHKICEHKNLKYCKQCDIVYCVDCGKEWSNTNWAICPNYTYGNYSGGTYTGKYSDCLTGGNIN